MEQSSGDRTVEHFATGESPGGTTHPRLQRVVRLFFLFIPFSMLAPTLQVGLIDIAKAWQETSWDLTSISQELWYSFLLIFLVGPLEIYLNPANWPWPILVSALNAVTIVGLDGRLRRFWLVAISWAGACALGDGIIDLRRIGDLPMFIEDLGFDAVGGLFMGWLLYWPLSRVALRSGVATRQRQQSLPAWAMQFGAYYPGDRLHINIWGIVTGWATIALGFFYWGAWCGCLLLFMFFPFSSLLFLMIATPSVKWPDALTALAISALLPGEWIISALLGGWLSLAAVVVAGLLIVAVHRCYRSMKSALLLYRRKLSWVYFAVFSIWLAVGNVTEHYLHPMVIPQAGLLLEQWASITNAILIPLLIGFFFAATSPRPGQAIIQAVPGTRLLANGIIRIRSVASSLVQAYSPPASVRQNMANRMKGLHVWYEAIVHPVTTLERLLAIPNEWGRLEELAKLAIAACTISIALAIGLAFVLGVPGGEVLRGAPGRILVMGFMLTGGLACHILFRVFRLPSKLTSTLLLYAVPQAVCLPILSALSVPVMFLEHSLFISIRDQNLDLIPALLRAIAVLPTISLDPGRIAGLMNVLSGFVTASLVIFFLEGYWQHYRVLRTRAYSIGFLVWIINLALVYLATPFHVVAVYSILRLAQS